MKKTRIMLADDHSLMRMGLKALLGFQPDMSVVGETDDGKKAVALAAELSPDIIIMDLMMPVMNGAEATGRILEDFPEMKVIILTSFGTSADLLRAIANGAKGVHLKESPMEELLETIRTVAAGGEAMPEEVRQMMDENPTAPALTARQTEILRAISNGTTTEGIAHQLNISQSCIKQHLAAIFKKLGATSRSEAVAIAMRKQLLKI